MHNKPENTDKQSDSLKVGDHIKIGDRIIRIAGMSTQNVEDLSDDLILEIPISILDPDERG